jgi:hypothetical protein
LIDTLLITILTESVILLGYALWRRNPVLALLLTGICINILTQSLLWIGLNVFYRDYLAALIVGEVLIWGLESAVLYAIPANQLPLTDAILLGLVMNLASFALGWFLPL